MKRPTSMKSLAATAAALSLMTGSIASAAPAVAPTINPLVALSAFGTAQSRAALCTAGATAVTAAAQEQQRCVLPAVDTPPPAVVSEVPPPPPVLVEPGPVIGAPNFLPVLLALGAFAAIYFLLGDELLGDDDDEDAVSPF